MLNHRVTLIVVLLSVVGALGFGLKTWRERSRVYELVLASGSQTGEYYAFSEAFAAVVEQNHPHIRIEVIATEGSADNMTRLRDNTAQLALVQSDTPVERPVRAIARLFPEMFHLLVRQDANIQTVGDLRDRRIALMPEGSGSYALFWPLVEHYNLSEADFQALPQAPETAYESLLAGDVDALFRVITLGNPSMKAVLQNDAIALLAIDQVEALQLALPYLEAQTIPKGTYDGGRPLPRQDLPVVGVNALLVIHENLPDEVAHALTETLYTHRNELVSRYPRAALIRLPSSGNDLGLPLHPGAQAFYDRDQPEFIVEYAEPIGLLISVSVLLASSLWQFRIWLKGRQKNRADYYNIELLDLIDQINQTPNAETLEDLRQQLFKMLRDVVSDLDNDLISADSFESFTFPWEIALNSLRYQEATLLKRLPSTDVPTHQP
ncbi:TAXI family TRAP transporter solute-binding subunit [Leptolyngbya iicbica]|uniref:TAXI family TRAP transporter solute-binding subunit n=1 Tax=Leptolyngbya iicbica TaxID=3161580 RepID=UPI00068C0AFF|nr:TAXI family TRAP transporter solute-binding subunit [Leptolyngbya sp. LK]